MAAALLMLVATAFEIPGMRHPPAGTAPAAMHDDHAHHARHAASDHDNSRHMPMHASAGEADETGMMIEGKMAQSDQDAWSSCFSCPLCLCLAVDMPVLPLAQTPPRPQSREGTPLMATADPDVPPPRLRV